MSNQLQQIISDTQTSLRSNPELGKTIFNSRSALQEGFHSEVNLRQHQITVDEPLTLGGTDQGPNPVELILAALGTCQEITYRAYATALGIPLESVSVELEGELDLRGFFAGNDQVRAGYQQIKGTVRLQSNASAEKLQQ